MTNNRDILAITNAIQYFQKPISEATKPQELEAQIIALRQILQQEQLVQQMPATFIASLLSLIVQRYYELATRSHQVREQYLLVVIVRFVHRLYQKVQAKGKTIDKDLMVILMSATVTQAKSAFDTNIQSTSDLRPWLLSLNFGLLTDITARQDFKIEQIYPKEYSLCSNILKNSQISFKEITLCLQTLMVLVGHNVKLKNSNDCSKFTCECLKRLLIDVQFLCDSSYKYGLGFKKKVEDLALQLLKIFQNDCQSVKYAIHTMGQQDQAQNIRQQLFSSTILLAQLSGLSIEYSKFNLYQRSLIDQSYLSLYISTCQLLIKTEINIELKKRELAKLAYLIKFVTIENDESDQVLSVTVKFLSKMFSIGVKHSLITIPHHATTIPLDPLRPTHCMANYPVAGLADEYRKEQTRIIVQLMPFFELQLNLVALVVQIFEKLSEKSRQALLHYFSDELLKQDYNLNMPVVKLYSYIQLLSITNFILAATPEIHSSSAVNALFQSLGNKSEVVKRLKASYVQEELLISLTIEIVNRCCNLLSCFYRKQGEVRAKIKNSQIAVILIQKLLNQLAESSYIIRLICTIALLDFVQQDTLERAIRPYQATVVFRNKNNLELILNLFEITTMNQIDYQELAEYYLKHKGAQPVLRYLLPKVSIQMGRKCLLTVQRWWLLLNREVIQWLNCKQMNKALNQTQIFATNDGENVTIKNALGVIIIEMGQKWIFYLRSQKRQTIIDILLTLVQVNPTMVFFKSGFTKVLKQLYRILAQCLGKEDVEVSVIKHKDSTSGLLNKLSVQETSKVEFYNRLRQKIYVLLNSLPQDYFQLYDSQLLQLLRNLLLQNFQLVQKQYLFGGNSEMKRDYDLLKPICSKLEGQ